MNIAQKAVEDLFEDKHERRKVSLKYSRRFSAHNANVKYSSSEIMFSLSHVWEEVSPEIQQGLIEHLLCRVYGEKRESINQDLYHSYMKNLSKFSRNDEKDPYLLERFYLINEKYFHGLMDAPNLKWGRSAYTKLGHYEYASDTVVISSIFSNAPSSEQVQELSDFVLYHEMLHKKHKYDHTKSRAVHHSKAFRADERKWHDKQIEQKLKWFVRKKRLKKAFLGW